MRTIVGTATLTAALLTLAACGDDDSATISPEDCDGPPQVTVTDAGSEPRDVMEMSPTAGDTVALDMQMEMSSEVRVDGDSMPSGSVPVMTIGMETTVDEVTDDEIRMSFVYDRVDAGDDAATAGLFEPMVGMSGTLTTTRNGAFIDGEVDADGLDPVMSEAVGQFEQMLADMTVPFPTEPVGAGAEWDMVSSVETSGLTLCNTATYHLVEFDGDAYELDVEVSQQALPGTLDEGGVTAELAEFEASGTGNHRGNLSFPLAVSGSSNVTTEMEMKLEQDGTEHTQEMTMSITTEIAPRE
ncbi:hypothetical protein [Phytoactinopolyspora halotolerans]|uniref:Uncharacterized protein n=1 Tax=Phytoactinopolyspora halotolerans TaxID=1981512 RepID=A0A6L9SAK5_9ACTN|nr:hypothetical protein [Phytoactinopolyspora halotolerans]NEE01602.1 hypothetical protein [Phytoactinopolyspora halotolerans]